MKPIIVCTVLIFFSLSQVSSMNITVDNSLSYPTSSSVPNLYYALGFLLNPSTGQLYDTSNTITLLNNTAGTIQALPNVASIASNGGISIMFQNTPQTVTSIHDCNALPIIPLSASQGYSVSITGLQYLSIQGVFFVIATDSSKNTFTNIPNLTMNSFCLNDTNPSSTSSSLYEALTFTNIGSLTLSNWFLGHQSLQAMTINGATDISIQNLTLYLEHFPEYLIPLDFSSNPYTAITITGTSSTIIGSVNIYNTSLLCPRASQISQGVIRVNLVTNVTLSATSLSNCSFYRSNTNMISIKNSNNVTVTNMTISNLTLTLNTLYIPQFYEALYISNSIIITVSGFYVNDLNSAAISDIDADGLTILEFDLTNNVEASSITLQNFNLMNSQINGKCEFIQFTNPTPATIPTALIQGITIQSNSMYFGAFIKLVPSALIQYPFGNLTQVYTVENFQILNNTIIDISLVEIINEILQGLYNEVLFLNINNLIMQNNTFGSFNNFYPFDVSGSQVSITNFQANNNAIGNSTMFIDSVRVSTFTFVNSSITNLILGTGGTLFGYNQQQSVSLTLQPTFFDKTLLTYQVEDKPFMIINCTFTNITMAWQSALISSSNPMIILINNTFSNITSNQAGLISFGEYLPPIPKPQNYTYTDSKTTLFQTNPALQTVFSDSRLIASSYSSNQATAWFFLVILNNTFQGIYTTEETYSVSIADINLETSAIVIANNNISGAIINTNKDYSFIRMSDISQAAITSNLAYNLTGGGRLISLTSTAISELFLDSNTITNSSDVAGYLVSSQQCNQIVIQNENISNIQSTSTWIQLTCAASNSPIVLQQSSYSNITIASTPDRLFGIQFLSIQIELGSNTSSNSILLIGNVFMNIIVNKTRQLFAQTIFDMPIILLSTSGSTVTIENSIFIGMQNIPLDNIVSISSAQVVLDTCNFTDFRFYEDSNALYVVFGNLLLNNLNFSGIQGEQGSLVNLVNPDSSNIATATISNSTFTGNNANLVSFQDLSISLTIVGTVITNNTGLSSGLISFSAVTNSLLNITDTFFGISTAGIISNYGFLNIANSTEIVNISISNCHLSVEGAVAGMFITLQQNSQVELNVNKLTYDSNPMSVSSSRLLADSSAAINFGLLQADNVTATFNQLSVQNLMLNATDLFLMNCLIDQSSQSVATLNLVNSSWENLSFASGTIIHLTATNLLHNATEFCDLAISIDTCDFTSISSSTDGLIIKSDSSLVAGNTPGATFLNVVNSNFFNLNTQNGSLYFGERFYNGITTRLFNNSFVDITVYNDGGIFYVQNTGSDVGRSTFQCPIANVNASECLIIQNSTFTGISIQNGGILYSSYSSSVYSTILVLANKNTFSNINAAQRGAILFVNDSQLYTDNTDNFVESSIVASIEGQYVYSNGIQILSGTQINNSTMAFAPNYLGFEFIPSDFGRIQTDANILYVTNIESFSLADAFIQFNLQYSPDFQSYYNISSNDKTNGTALINFDMVTGNKTASNTSCVGASCQVSLNQIILIGKQNDQITVTLSYTSDRVFGNSQSNLFIIIVRGCIPGEINNTVGQYCTYCQSGTYSFNTSDPYCNTCPENAICSGGTNIYLDPGFWRDATDSANIIPCNDTASDHTNNSRCLGGEGINNCSTGYSGPLCQQCNFPNYLSKGAGDCYECKDQTNVLIAGIFLFLLSIAYQIFAITTAYKDSQKSYEELQSITYDPSQPRPPKPGVYISIFTAYAQLTSVFSNINKGFLSDAFAVATTLGNPIQKVFFTLQCFLVLTTTTPFEVLRAKVMMFTFSPLAKLILVLIWQLLSAIFKTEDQAFRKAFIRIGVTAVGLFNLELPGIVGALCDYLSCLQLDPLSDTLYVSSDTNVVCTASDYLFFRNYFVLPALLIWGFLLPLILILILYFRRAKLMRSRTLYVVFGVYYSGYGMKAFYWGLCTVVFKITMFVCNSVLPTANLNKILALSLVVHIYFTIHRIVAPNLFQDLRLVEQNIIRAYQWTLLVMLLQSNMPDTTAGNDIGILLEVLIIVFNSFAIAFLLQKLLKTYTKKFSNRIDILKDKLRIGKKKHLLFEEEKANPAPTTETLKVEFSEAQTGKKKSQRKRETNNYSTKSQINTRSVASGNEIKEVL